MRRSSRQEIDGGRRTPTYVTAAGTGEAKSANSRWERIGRLFAVVLGVIQAALAVGGGFSAVGTTVTAVSAVFWLGLAWIGQFRPSMLRGVRVVGAVIVGVALVVASGVVGKSPSDRPRMPTVKRTDVQAGHLWATSACAAYARSVLAPALLLRDASQAERTHANRAADAMRAKSASDAKRAAGSDRRWQPLYLAAWRVNERWRGNPSVSDHEYRMAATAIGGLCQPLTDRGQ
jgi:hypothetical protein